MLFKVKPSVRAVAVEMSMIEEAMVQFLPAERAHIVNGLAEKIVNSDVAYPGLLGQLSGCGLGRGLSRLDCAGRHLESRIGVIRMRQEEQITSPARQVDKCLWHGGKKHG